MFHHLEGKIEEISQNLVVLSCGGLGFAVNATLNTISKLKIGETRRLYIAEAIGENNFDLYGFADKSEKRCFEMLLSVSGVGPKAALSILSHSSPDNLALAIINDDAKALTVAPGIGKKIAQRIILELKDKIAKEFNSIDASIPQMPMTVQGGSSNVADALTALGVLGYTSAEVGPALKKIDTTGMTAEEIIKAVLKQMVN